MRKLISFETLQGLIFDKSDASLFAVHLYGKLTAVDEEVSGPEYGQCLQVIIKNIGEHPYKTDLCFEALAYLSLKQEFKQILVTKLDAFT